MFTKLSKRRSRRLLVVEFNPYQILAAEISRPPRGPAVLEAAVEFEREDTAGLRQWIETGDDGRRVWMNVLCGLVPVRGIVHRESVLPRRLGEPDYLVDVVQEQQKGRFLSATPFKILKSGQWTLRAVGAVDGAPLGHDGGARPALICGVANDELHEAQQRLVDLRLLPDRIEPGLLSLFGVVFGSMERRGDMRAVVIVVIHETATAVYILGKEGVHTPNPVLHGFASLLEVARKELGAKDDAEARTLLQSRDPAAVSQAAKLVRRIGRDLKPVVDSFEMTTGQPVDELLCAYLPPALAWLAEPLARVTGRTPYHVDCDEWLPTVGLQTVEGGPRFGPHWLGALSLVAHLPETSELKAERAGGEPAEHRPWHVDCRLHEESDERRLAGRRLLTGAVAAALATFVVAVTSWQLYATDSLRTDTRYWEQQMTDNRRLFDELTAANAALKSQSRVLDRAYELMGAPYQLSDFLLNLGRTIPARMRVDRIETNDTRVAISGALLEPAEEASGTLGRYMDELRRNPAIGPLFASITITSLQRKTNSEAVIFEITLRLHRSTP